MRPRTILYTGKGGVGKTSVAAATARRCAQDGTRTLAISTDPAHSLGDAFGVRLSATPRPIPHDAGGTLHAIELDAPRAFEIGRAHV